MEKESGCCFFAIYSTTGVVRNARCIKWIFILKSIIKMCKGLWIFFCYFKFQHPEIFTVTLRLPGNVNNKNKLERVLVWKGSEVNYYIGIGNYKRRNLLDLIEFSIHRVEIDSLVDNYLDLKMIWNKIGNWERRTRNAIRERS